MSMPATAWWTPVALSADVPPRMVIPATLPVGPIAVWRSQSGQVTANHDRCPHRGMRLSHGFVRGEKLSCIYHGWSFGKEGGCTAIPAHPKVTPPASIHCGVMPTVEQDGLIWVASAQPDTAPPVFDQYQPLRMLNFCACIDRIKTVCDASSRDPATDTYVTATLAGFVTRLIVTPLNETETNVFILVSPDLSTDQKIAISRAAEVLRNLCERPSPEGQQT